MNCFYQHKNQGRSRPTKDVADGRQLRAAVGALPRGTVRECLKINYNLTYILFVCVQPPNPRLPEAVEVRGRARLQVPRADHHQGGEAAGHSQRRTLRLGGELPERLAVHGPPRGGGRRTDPGQATGNYPEKQATGITQKNKRSKKKYENIDFKKIHQKIV